MTPDTAKASLARLLAAGDSVFLQRGVAPGPVTRSTSPVQARFTSYTPEQLVGPISEGDRRVIVSADDVAASGFPLPLRENDRVDLGGRLLTIKYVDDTTRRVAGVLVGYELRVSG